jgi:hypothetical protein
MPTETDISEEILEYLRTHPKASDTLEGIAEWWLLNQKIKFGIERVRAAIYVLLEEGSVIEIKGKDSTVRYRLNPEKIENMKIPVNTCD